jgi:EAL and modified HD-GYP domain-containing signal transduction protein
VDLFVARQPIFDRHRKVVAYELLFRSGLQNAFGNADPTKASRQMLDTTLLGFGLDALIGDKFGYFNATRDVLVNQHWSLLPRERTVIEVLETVEPDAEVVAACQAAKTGGYRLALDDFVFRPDYEALLKLTDVVKVDFLATRGAERQQLAQQFVPRGITMLAEKVENYEEYQAGLDAGYELFQGYFFCKPEMVTGKDVPAVKSNLLRLIQEINRPDVDFDNLERIIKSEVALSVRLLRYLRSAGFGWRHDIESIGQALRVLGESNTRKWASLVALTMIGEDKPAELITTSLVRAQLCEQLGIEANLPDRQSDLFLAGLLSTLDALLDKPMGEILSQLAITDEIRSALSGGDTALGETLQLAVSYDRADWERVAQLAPRMALPAPVLPIAYRHAVEWVNTLNAV